MFTRSLVLCFAKGLYCTVPRLKIGFASQLMNGRFHAHLTFFHSRELSFQTIFYTFLFLVDWNIYIDPNIIQGCVFAVSLDHVMENF